MKCQKCLIRPARVGVIVGSKYLNLCYECRPLPQVSSGHAKWARTIDLEDNEANIQQPYNADGSINAQFAKLYPTQAKAIFTDKQIRDANR